MADTWNGIPIIDESTDSDFTHPTENARGAVPRDYAVQPVEMMASADEIPLLSEDEMVARYTVLKESKAQLSDVIKRARARGRFKDRYQNGDGLCWSHSTTHGIMVAREVDNLPPKTLSAYMLACLSDGRGYRNQGAWAALSAQTAEEIGVCEDNYWAEGNRSSVNDTAKMRENALENRVTGLFADLARPVWFQNIPFKATLCCLLSGRPVMVDFNWWGHSVCGVDAVLIEPGSWGIMILNSWGLSWGEQGFAILRGNRAIPDGSVCVNTVRKSVNAVFSPETPLAV